MRVLLYYKYVNVPDPEAEVRDHLSLCKELGLKGRILISKEGLNGTCSGTIEACEVYKKYLNAHPLFSQIAFKESDHSEHVFDKIFVRLRNEVVTLSDDVDPRKAAPYITPKDLHEALERGDDLVVIDMRNDYEAAVGKFRNAVTLNMKNFRDLPGFLPELEQFKHSAVVTYCTGGIRCEKASGLLLKHGFTNVRQLEGGIVKYCEEFPNGYFDGSLFVFDKRMTVRFPGVRKPTYVSHCMYCSEPCDRCVNCSDPKCHNLIICCEPCAAKREGLCRELATRR